MSVQSWRDHWGELHNKLHWADMDWVEELLYLNLAAMEACIIYPWYLLLNALSENMEQSISLGAMCVLVWIPYLVAGLINRTDLALDRKQALVAGLVILTALAALRFFVYSDAAFGNLDWVAEFR